MNHRSNVRMGDAAQQEAVTDWYTYSVLFSDLALGTSQTGSINIEADSDFQIIKLTAAGIIDAETEPVKDVLQCSVLLTDTGSGRNLMNQSVMVPSLFGTGELPFILPQPKLLYMRSVLAITITNLSRTVNYQTLQLSFIGRKIYPL